MKIRIFLPIALIFALATMSYASNAPLISPDQLKSVLSDSNLTILDVRTGSDWETSEYKIKGAHRAAPEDFDAWSDKYNKNGHYVLYCS